MSKPVVVYADHDGVRSNASPLDAVWMELFEERQERSALAWGATFCFEATHLETHSWERGV